MVYLLQVSKYVKRLRKPKKKKNFNVLYRRRTLVGHFGRFRVGRNEVGNRYLYNL